jgi:hypothetical protein
MTFPEKCTQWVHGTNPNMGQCSQCVHFFHFFHTGKVISAGCACCHLESRFLINTSVTLCFANLTNGCWNLQGLRERWLADPRFLQRLAIEESISITTTLLAQYQRRGDRFWNEIEYVITDSVRGAVVDFFTVWLPAPTLSFRSLDTEVSYACNPTLFNKKNQ